MTKLREVMRDFELPELSDEEKRPITRGTFGLLNTVDGMHKH
jgi:hypothetical protein